MVKQYPHTYWEESIKNPYFRFVRPTKKKEIRLYNLQTQSHLITIGQIYKHPEVEYHLQIVSIGKDNRNDSNEDAWIYFKMLDPNDYSKEYYEGVDSFRAWNLDDWKLVIDVQ